MVVFGVINVGIALWLNLWNRDFFNALEKRDTTMLTEQLYILAAIVVSAGVSVAIHLHIRRRLQIYWRGWLTQVTARLWLHAGRQYQLGYYPARQSRASTRSHSACPPVRHVESARRRRSGLSKPVQAANAAAHSAGSWLW